MSRALVAVCAWVSMLVAAPAYAQEGAALYAQRCASCHEGGQVARAPARDVIAALTPERIVGALEIGDDAGAGRIAHTGAAARDRRVSFRVAAGACQQCSSGAGLRPALRGGQFSAVVFHGLARVGRDSRQRSLSAAARILVRAGSGPQVEMGVRVRRRERRGRQPDDRRRSRVRRQRLGTGLRTGPEGRLHALDVQG